MVEGIEIKTGEFLVNSTPDGNTTTTTIIPEINVFTGIRADGLAIILLLLSLYLAFFSISEIIREKYGDADVE